MVSESMVPCATLMLIGSAGARSPLFSAGVAVTAATGGDTDTAWLEPVVLAGSVFGLTPAGPVVDAAEDGGVPVPAAPGRPPGDPAVQPAVAAIRNAAIEPMTQRW
ncbi:MAG TPA: hypothetical protein VIC62_11880 [Nakamurella sp.]|jgi:hypothetical protein